MINVTKTYLPPFEDYIAILKRAWDKGWVTNHGELVQELEAKLKTELGVSHLLFCSNGTIVLQMALKALNITKEVITTPFSYVATTNAILWEGCKPIFVDIDPETLCIDASKIEDAITKDTEAILATHVYGFPCDVEAIDIIAKKHKLKVIYDGAHAFGCEYGGKTLLHYGDVSTCSFHATKLFHTVEGGCVIAKNQDVSQQLLLYRQFGHIGDHYFSEGINAKNSEFHAAMGLAVLPKVSELIEGRRIVFEHYEDELPYNMKRLKPLLKNFKYNFSYYPVIFDEEEELIQVKSRLQDEGIYTRRYFFPSLNLLPQTITDGQRCPISENIAQRILCLPIYPDLSVAKVKMICKAVRSVLV